MGCLQIHQKEKVVLVTTAKAPRDPVTWREVLGVTFPFHVCMSICAVQRLQGEEGAQRHRAG